jgi:hypothetical protein
MESVIGATRSLRLKAKRGAFAAQIGEPRQIRSTNNKIFVDFSYSLRFAY